MSLEARRCTRTMVKGVLAETLTLKSVTILRFVYYNNVTYLKYSVREVFILESLGFLATHTLIMYSIMDLVSKSNYRRADSLWDDARHHHAISALNYRKDEIIDRDYNQHGNIICRPICHSTTSFFLDTSYSMK
jgi:hypothetical protein